MSVPDWFSNLIQTAEAAEQQQQQLQRAQPSEDVQAQHALAQALTNAGYDPTAQQQQLSSTAQGNGFLDQPQHQLQSHINAASTSQYEGGPSRWIPSADEVMNEPFQTESHELEQPSLDQLGFKVNNGGASSNGNVQPQVSSSSSSNGLVSAYSAAPHPRPIPSDNNNDQNPSSSSLAAHPTSSAVFPSSPAKRPRRASSTSSSTSKAGPTPSPQTATKRRKSDTTTPNKQQQPEQPVNRVKGEEEDKLDQAMDKLKEKVPALRTFFQILPLPSPISPNFDGLVDGVLPPKVDEGATTVVKTSASYVHVLQRERDAGKRMIAGLEGVLKATGGEEMLDAWRAQLAVLEEERAEADGASATLATQTLVNQNGKGREKVDRPLLDLNSPPSSLQPPNDPSSSSTTTTATTTTPGLVSLPSQPHAPLPSSSTTITTNPTSIDPLNPNYYDPTSYAIDSHDFMTYPSGDPVVASADGDGNGGGGGGGGPKSKQEIAREKNREKQRRFRERQKARVAELEAKLRELKKGEVEAEGEEEEERVAEGVGEEEGVVRMKEEEEGEEEVMV